MSKFVKLVRKNRNGEERELILNVEDIHELTEINSSEEITKYSETTGEPLEYATVKHYVVGFGANGKTYEITEESANELMKHLLP